MNRQRVLFIASALTALLVVAGCGSSLRTTVDGYDDSMLNGKTVYVLLPDTGSVRLTSAVNYASSRGIVSDGARDMLYGEMRTRLIESLDERLDSNTILSYASHTVAGLVPLTTAMFTNGTPNSWDQLTRAGREGVFDYMIVLYDFSITTQAATSGKGDETIETGYALLDVTNQRVMTSGRVTAEVEKPAGAGSVYQKLAEELSRKLPFWVSQPA